MLSDDDTAVSHTSTILVITLINRKITKTFGAYTDF
jgi:hypothetical protein